MIAALLAASLLAGAAGGAPVPVGPGSLRVTLGAAEPTARGFRVETAKLRAVADRGRDEAELRFRYLGRTAELARLRSGEARAQLGLKLRAADGCNLLYVMWRLEPVPGLVVSLKRNPGQRSHAACGNRGYVNLRPSSKAALPPLAPGGSHVLHAAIVGRELVVKVDGAPVWRGPLPDEALGRGGPIGLRSDNVRLELELLAPM